MSGKCLCGEVSFKLKDNVPNLYQCHCSLCRKATGAEANAATLVNKANLVWVSGEKNIKSYEDSTGFRSNFCDKCGSPLPNIVKGTEVYWVPAGLLERANSLKIVAHILTDSKAEWGVISAEGVQYKDLPEIDELIKILHHS